MNINSPITVKKDMTFRESYGTITCLEVVFQYIQDARSRIPPDSIDGAVSRLLLHDLMDLIVDEDEPS